MFRAQQLWHASCLALIAYCGFAHAKGKQQATIQKLIFNFNNTSKWPFELNCYEYFILWA